MNYYVMHIFIISSQSLFCKLSCMFFVVKKITKAHNYLNSSFLLWRLTNLYKTLFSYIVQVPYILLKELGNVFKEVPIVAQW